METLLKLQLSELNPPLNPIVVHDSAGLARLKDFLERNKTFGIDTESNIADFFFHRKLRTIQIGNREEQYVIDVFSGCGANGDLLRFAQGNYGANLSAAPFLLELKSILSPYLDSNKSLKVGHGLRFDYEILKWCLGIRMWNLYDTQLANKVIHAGAIHLKTSSLTSLSGVCQEYLKINISKDEQTHFELDKPLTQEQIDYAALDCRLPLAIMAAQAKPLAMAGLNRTMQIENDALPAFGDMHLNGILIDREKWVQLLIPVKAKHKANLEELDKYFLPLVGSKHIEHSFAGLIEQRDIAELAYSNAPKGKENKEIRAELMKASRKAAKAYRDALKLQKKYEKDAKKFLGEAAINYSSNPQLIKQLRKMGFGNKVLPDTNELTLKKLEGEPVIDALREFRETNKILSTYGDQFLEDYIKEETGGRVHSYIDQLGAATGRTASEDPNVQNILHGEWRDCFISAAGWVMLTVDYNGCELRILAELSGEPVWLDAFKKGWDVHSVGAEIIFGPKWTAATESGCKYAEKHQKCKCAGHIALRDQIKAINFGIAYGMEAGKLSVELGIPKNEALALLLLYRGKFKKVTAYLTQSGQFAMSTLQSRTICGRRRLYPKPTWDKAKVAAIERQKKFGHDPASSVEQKHINSAMSGLSASIERMGKNTPIQGTNADMIKLAMGCGFDPDGKPYLWHILEPQFEAKLVNMVHDELVTEAKEEVKDECFAAIGDAMTRAGAEFIKQIPMTTDGYIAGYWKK